MALRVVGAGLGRTGTNSLKVALERLLGGRCYHMWELIERPDDTAAWHAAVRGEPVDWTGLMPSFVATVDWPACAFWRELLDASPGAIALLSTRDSAEEWWASMERTIVPVLGDSVPEDEPERMARRAMILELMERRFEPRWVERDAAIAAYERHNAEVRREAPPERLVDWRPRDGWGPICAALDVPVPEEPFPHTNRSAEFRVEQGVEGGGD